MPEVDRTNPTGDKCLEIFLTLIVTMNVAQLIKRLSPVLEDDRSNPTDDLCLEIFYFHCHSECGSVDKAVVSRARGRRIESHWQFVP